MIKAFKLFNNREWKNLHIAWVLWPPQEWEVKIWVLNGGRGGATIEHFSF